MAVLSAMGRSPRSPINYQYCTPCRCKGVTSPWPTGLGASPLLATGSRTRTSKSSIRAKAVPTPDVLFDFTHAVTVDISSRAHTLVCGMRYVQNIRLSDEELQLMHCPREYGGRGGYKAATRIRTPRVPTSLLPGSLTWFPAGGAGLLAMANAGADSNGAQVRRPGRREPKPCHFICKCNVEGIGSFFWFLCGSCEDSFGRLLACSSHFLHSLDTD